MARNLWLLVAFIVAFSLSGAGCAAPIEDASIEAEAESLTRPGPWHLPPEIRRIGERQFVHYDSAPRWDGDCARPRRRVMVGLCRGSRTAAGGGRVRPSRVRTT